MPKLGCTLGIKLREDTVWVAFEFMEQFMVDVFKGLGVPEEDAEICAEVLITSDKRGIDSHGVNRLKPMYYDRIKAGIIEVTGGWVTLQPSKLWS
jgi:LDH2 family malate/lactate/ureidoglycolate dehydrogenase